MGPIPNTADVYADTPLHFAARWYGLNDEWLDIAGLLIDAGADVKATSHMGTPLVHAGFDYPRAGDDAEKRSNDKAPR